MSKISERISSATEHPAKAFAVWAIANEVQKYNEAWGNWPFILLASAYLSIELLNLKNKYLAAQPSH